MVCLVKNYEMLSSLSVRRAYAVPSGLSVATLLRYEIEAYMREARVPVKVHLYQCECFTSSGTAAHT
jgi:hypothetical protein